MQQLLLTGSQAKALVSFDSYYAGPNQTTVDFLQHYISNQAEPYIYLWGDAGSGRSHLLQAVLQNAHSMQLNAVYIPLQNYAALQAEMLEGIEDSDLVCIDDIHLIAADALWEETLFDAFNRIRDAGTRLIITGDVPSQQLPLDLADLRSRLCWGLSLQLQPLTDEQKQQALKFAAKQRSFDLPDNVAQYLLTHFGRQQHELFTMLAKLDEASLVAKRKLTIPFVKQVLGE